MVEKGDEEEGKQQDGVVRSTATDRFVVPVWVPCTRW